ncbi:MAG: hypothetical protein ACOYVD_15055 [Bacillota bacterium]
MKLEDLMLRDWDCLRYCQTKEDCWAACRLVPPTETQIFMMSLEKEFGESMDSSDKRELCTVG